MNIYAEPENGDELSCESLEKALFFIKPDADFEIIRRACDFSRVIHQRQVRDDGTPYFYHPLRVALYLVNNMKVSDSEIIAAALLHDVIEDGRNVNFSVLREKFGERIAMLVHVLSKPEKIAGISRQKQRDSYNESLREAPVEALMIKIADRLDNVKSLSRSPYEEKKFRYVRETYAFYIPLAESVYSPAAVEMKQALRIINQGGERDGQGNAF